MDKDNIKVELTRLKKSNTRNTGIIIILMAILIFVSAMAIYVRFFS